MSLIASHKKLSRVSPHHYWLLTYYLISLNNDVHRSRACKHLCAPVHVCLLYLLMLFVEVYDYVFLALYYSSTVYICVVSLNLGSVST